MERKHNTELTTNARALRKNMTKEEKHLWYDFLKNLPCTFNRQKVIGDYIVDFYCATSKIVIEIDGWQHGTEENSEYDSIRTEYLESLGLKVLRYSNKDIHKKFNYICADILKNL